MDLAELTAATRDVLAARAHELVAAYLFGSVAHGSAGPRSDVDIGVLFKRTPAPGLSGLGFDIAFELEPC